MIEDPPLEPCVCDRCGRAGFREEFPLDGACRVCGGRMLVSTWAEYDAAVLAAGPEE